MQQTEEVNLTSLILKTLLYFKGHYPESEKAHRVEATSANYIYPNAARLHISYIYMYMYHIYLTTQ